MASESLAKFSELLRYQLYECNEHHIPLKQELMYIQNFIQMQKLRQDGNVTTSVDIEEPLSTELCIAPFVIMPFVENAFKHVSQYKGRLNWIKIDIRLRQQSLIADISNSAAQHHQSQEAVSFNGIGLANVQRRLELLYPGQYELDIKENAQQFQVKLKLNIVISTQANGQATHNYRVSTTNLAG
jgi:LytS/YehU family sensor histidine kinase